MRSMLLAGLVLAALPAAAQVTGSTAIVQPATAPGAATMQRVELPGAEGQPFPYTIEIPAAWQVRNIEGSPGVWLGPPAADPQQDPNFVYVRISPASLAEPEKVVASIRATDAQSTGWSAPVVEVREVGGAKGVLVRMESGEGMAARTTLALKLPAGEDERRLHGLGAEQRVREAAPPLRAGAVLGQEAVLRLPVPRYRFRGVAPRLGARVWLAPGAHVAGDVELGDDVSFWFNTVARGDVNWITDRRPHQRAGRRGAPRDARAPPAGDRGRGSSIGHAAVLHGCTVEDGALVGIGARVLDGAVVEAGAQVGAGAVVAPGARIPAGHLALGVPARVARPLSDDERRAIGEIAERYVGLKEIYRTELGEESA